MHAQLCISGHYYLHCNENPIYVFLFWELCRLSSISNCSRHMNVEIRTVSAQFLFWEFLFQIFGIVSLQCTPYRMAFVPAESRLRRAVRLRRIGRAPSGRQRRCRRRRTRGPTPTRRQGQEQAPRLHRHRTCHTLQVDKGTIHRQFYVLQLDKHRCKR